MLMQLWLVIYEIVVLLFSSATGMKVILESAFFCTLLGIATHLASDCWGSLRKHQQAYVDV